jgi:peptide/nickel transport system substrate-binding protein
MSILLSTYRFRLFATMALAGISAASVAAENAPKNGGTLIYLEQQAHTNLYPPAGGFTLTAESSTR